MSGNEQNFIFRMAGFLMIVNVLSRVLGYVRDVLLLNIFGQSIVTDAYNAAFSIPDTLYQILIGGAMSSAFIPVFASYVAKKEMGEAWKVSSIFTSWILVLMGAGIIFSLIFTPELMSVLTDFTAGVGMQLTVILTKIMLVQALFMALSAIAMAVLHSHQHFIWPAIGSLLYNVLIVVCGYFLVEPIENIWPGYGIAGFSIGVVIGSVLFLAVQIPMLKKIGFKFNFSLDLHHPGVRKLIALMIPALIGLSVSQINLLVTQKLATGLDGGVYTAMRMAYRFMQLPIGVFAVAIAVTYFPTMTKQAALNKMKEFKDSLSLSLRSVAFIMIPSAVGLAVLREPIIRLLFEFKGGEFTPEATVVAGEALLFYCIGLVGYGLAQVLLRGFYAMQNTITPVIISVSSIVINIIFSMLLVGPMGHMGLALAFSLAGLFQAAVLFIFLRKKIGQMDLRRICSSIIRTSIACVAMGLSAWGIAGVFDLVFADMGKLMQLVQLGCAMGVAVVLFFVITYMMKMEEAKLVLDIFRRKLLKKKSGANRTLTSEQSTAMTKDGTN